jgi:hypothetical protein
MIINPGQRVQLRDSNGITSYGLALRVRSGNGNGDDCLVLLDDPETKDPWGPVKPSQLEGFRDEFEQLVGRPLTDEDRIGAPDILDTLPGGAISWLWIVKTLTD